jgi:hypothetical protein
MGLSLRLGLGVIVSLGSVASPTARAAQLASDLRLNTDDMNLRPSMILDQSGRRILMPTRDHAGPVALTNGSIPSYMVYHVGRVQALPKDFPTVTTGPARAGQTIGPLHFDAAVKAQLDQTLAQDGQAAVHGGKATVVVKPIVPLFGSTDAAGGGTTLAWLASQAAANRSGSSASTSTSKVPTTSPAAQVLIPANIADPITNAKVIKDLQHLFSIKHGKMPNWNQQTLNALKADLGISSPHNVAPHLATSTTPSKSAAEMLDLSSTGTGTPQPAPVPEPASVVIFGLAAFALAARSRLTRRSSGA